MLYKFFGLAHRHPTALFVGTSTGTCTTTRDGRNPSGMRILEFPGILCADRIVTKKIDRSVPSKQEVISLLLSRV